VGECSHVPLQSTCLPKVDLQMLPKPMAGAEGLRCKRYCFPQTDVQHSRSSRINLLCSMQAPAAHSLGLPAAAQWGTARVMRMLSTRDSTDTYIYIYMNLSHALLTNVSRDNLRFVITPQQSM
jgi:hypothetical protein